MYLNVIHILIASPGELSFNLVYCWHSFVSQKKSDEKFYLVFPPSDRSLYGCLFLILLWWKRTPGQEGTKSLRSFLTTLAKAASPFPQFRVPHHALFHPFVGMHTLMIICLWFAQGLPNSMYSRRSRPVVVNHGQFWPPRGHFPMSGDIFICYNCGGGLCYWQLVGRGQEFC